ncbi:MAG: clostripain-related cysteine peptidase [Oscillospiraceae bacterium]
MKQNFLIVGIIVAILIMITGSLLIQANNKPKITGTVMIAGSDKPKIKAKHNPKDWNQGVKPKKIKPYTVLIYLINADINTDQVNIVLHTGGTSRWNNNRITADINALYQIENKELNLLKEVGLLSMGEPETLRDFLDFGLTNYPAQQNLLVFWGHAGGVNLGYGLDENFQGDTLMLDEMLQALEQANLPPKIFDLIAFDTCLMANIETAQVVQDYGKYLLASQGLTPGRGFDYQWVKQLSENESLSMEALGKQIITAFTEFYIGTKIGSSSTTLSLVNLSMVDKMEEELATLKKELLETGKSKELLEIRKTLPVYGEPDEYGANSDMVDLSMLIGAVEGFAPVQAKATRDALSDMIVFFQNSLDMNFSGGLSIYFPQ